MVEKHGSKQWASWQEEEAKWSFTNSKDETKAGTFAHIQSLPRVTQFQHGCNTQAFTHSAIKWVPEIQMLQPTRDSSHSNYNRRVWRNIYLNIGEFIWIYRNFEECILIFLSYSKILLHNSLPFYVIFHVSFFPCVKISTTNFKITHTNIHTIFVRVCY